MTPEQIANLASVFSDPDPTAVQKKVNQLSRQEKEEFAKVCFELTWKVINSMLEPSIKATSHKIFQSMSRKGNCHDNSVMENFFGILKQEMYYGHIYKSYDDLKFAINDFIKYYNEQRIKEKLGWMSPINYRLNVLAAKKNVTDSTATF